VPHRKFFARDDRMSAFQPLLARVSYAKKLFTTQDIQQMNAELAVEK
jgi:hypothetical protein